ncbi:hypothetical protein ACFLZB_00925 [Nanoarchaeota archaeon]
MYIDTHVHCRDLKESKKETIEHALYVAEKTGATAICAEPNTKPSLIDKETVEDYLRIAKQANSPVQFYGWVGVTMNYDKEKREYQTDQLRRAVELVRTNPQVVGLKFFPCHSVGDLGILNYHAQDKVFSVLAEEGYEGVIQIHAEDENINRKNKKKWIPEKPWTWNNARPEKSEIEMVYRVIGYAFLNNFRGKLHFAHISTVESVDRINNVNWLVQNDPYFQDNMQSVTCEATFQHLLLNTEFMKRENGLYLKCNPPVREKQLADYGLGSNIWCIGTDHAPHTKEEKLQKHMSGVTSLHFWARGIKYLREILGIREERLHKFIFENPRELLGLDIEPRKVTLEREVFTQEFAIAHYGFDPFRHAFHNL